MVIHGTNKMKVSTFQVAMHHQYGCPSKILSNEIFQSCSHVFLSSWRATTTHRWLHGPTLCWLFHARINSQGLKIDHSWFSTKQPIVINEFQSLKSSLDLFWISGAWDIFQLRWLVSESWKKNAGLWVVVCNASSSLYISDASEDDISFHQSCMLLIFKHLVPNLIYQILSSSYTSFSSSQSEDFKSKLEVLSTSTWETRPEKLYLSVFLLSTD